MTDPFDEALAAQRALDRKIRQREQEVARVVLLRRAGRDRWARNTPDDIKAIRKVVYGE